MNISKLAHEVTVKWFTTSPENRKVEDLKRYVVEAIETALKEVCEETTDDNQLPYNDYDGWISQKESEYFAYLSSTEDEMEVTNFIHDNNWDPRDPDRIEINRSEE